VQVEILDGLEPLARKQLYWRTKSGHCRHGYTAAGPVVPRTMSSSGSSSRNGAT
jgi:hypothetical protein